MQGTPMITTSTTPQTDTTSSEYRAQSGGRFELIEGEGATMIPTYMGHASLTRTVYDLLRACVRPQHSGEVYSDLTFTVADFGDPLWVKQATVPDVSFFAGTRVADYKINHPNWRDWPMALVPDLTVEVQSAGDSYPYVLRKVAFALGVGVQEVWVINQNRLSVTVHKADGESVTLPADQTLRSDLILEWSILVRDLFIDPSGIA
jgi:Uma2 family endonuclease